MTGQSQRSLSHQFGEGYALIVKAGFYDLADWMMKAWEQGKIQVPPLKTEEEPCERTE